MKILIINPPAFDNVKIVREGRCMQRQEAWGTSWAPLTLALIAAILRDAGFVVDIKDCSNDGISFARLKNMIRDFKPALIVANTSTPSITSDLKVADIAKEADKDIKTVFFGIHVTALPETVFKENPNVEFIASGEPEYTIRDLALALRDSRPINEVKGLVYKKGDKVVYNEKRPFIENLDEMPFPAWDLVDVGGYRLPLTNRPFLLILTGRACPNPCKFCAASTFYGSRTRLRSWRKIVDEIKYVRQRYKVNDFLFWAENGIANKEQMYQICRGLAKEAPGVKWVCNGRVDLIDEDLLKAMKDAGCWMIGYGLESGSQKMLDLMRKNVTIKDIERAIKLTKAAGIEVTTHVIVGYPGETKKDILNTSKLVNKLAPDYIQVYCCVPFPGSQLYDEAIKSGWLEDGGDWSMYEQNFSILNTTQLTSKDVMKLRKKVVKKFYINPRRILKIFTKMKSPREILSSLVFAKRYLKSWIGD